MAAGTAEGRSSDRGGTTIGSRSKGQGPRTPSAQGAGVPGAVGATGVGAYVGVWPEGQAGGRSSLRDAHSDGRGSGHGRGRPGLLAVAARVSEILGGLVDPRIVREVGRLTGDDLDAVTEVVLDAKETGCLERGAEAWRMTAPLPTRRLVALATARLGELPLELREEACLLALGSPMTIRAAGAVLDPRHVRELEALGWARFRRRGRDQQVVIADPVRREAVLSRLADGHRLRLLRRLADAVEGCGDDQQEVVLRQARWRLEVGGWTAARYEAAAAVAYARSDTVLAEALAARAVEVGDRGQGLLMHAVTLTAHHQVERAEAVEVDARDDGRLDRARVSLAQAHRQAIGHGRWGLAARALEETVDDVTPSPSTAQLRAYSALLHAFDGDPRASDRARGSRGGGDDHPPIDRCARHSGHRSPGVETRVVAEVATAFSAAARLDRPGVKRSAAVVAELSSGNDEVPLASELVRGLALLAADPRPPQELLVSASEELEQALDGPDPILAWWMTVAGRLHLAGGDLDAARGRFVQALLLTDVADPVRLRPRLIADLALVAALSGVPTEAQRRLEELGEEPRVSNAIAFRCELVDIVIAAQYHGPVEATRTALTCGDRAVEEGRLRDAVFAWHLTARFGDARVAMERLKDTALPDHPVVASARRHAVAMAGQYGPELLLVARDLAAAGRYLVAAESAAQAARLTGAAEATALAQGLAAACTDVRNPVLEGIVPVVLSPRRAEVAQAVARGKNGPTIASELGLSLRTVNNHLARVYRLLGVANRQELQRVYRADLRPLAG